MVVYTAGILFQAGSSLVPVNGGSVMSINGKQLYGLDRLLASIRMARHKELKGLSIKKKLALNDVSKESTLTKLDGKIYSNTFTPYYPSPAYDRFLKGLISVVSGEPCPIITNFAVTAKCPCRCWHCSFASRDTRGELTLEELKKAIHEVKDLGSSVIGITGGEPLLREDLEDIISCIGEGSMPLLFTTGFGLTPQRVRALKDAGLEIPVVSLDHYDPERHDRLRGKRGMHKYALDAIEMFKTEGFYVAVSFVPDRKLVEDREDIFKVIEFFRELGINDMRLTSPILSGHLTSRPEELLTAADVETVFEIQKKCTRTKGYPGVFAYDYFESERLYGCGAGFNYLFIDARGNLCPCDFTMVSFGNLRERPLKQIWNEMRGHFKLPGIGCYANKSRFMIASKKTDTWPLSVEDSMDVVRECPPSSGEKLPGFYTKMGMKT